MEYITLLEITEKYGMSRSTINKRIKKAGIVSFPVKDGTSGQPVKAVSMFDFGNIISPENDIDNYVRLMDIMLKLGYDINKKSSLIKRIDKRYKFERTLRKMGSKDYQRVYTKEQAKTIISYEKSLMNGEKLEIFNTEKTKDVRTEKDILMGKSSYYENRIKGLYQRINTDFIILDHAV